MAIFYDIFHLQPTAAHLSPIMDALADSRIDRLVVTIAPGSGKSHLLSIIYPLWELAIEPSRTLMCVGASEQLASGFVKAAMETIEYHPAWPKLFSAIRPAYDLGWSPNNGMFVTGRTPGLANPSYAAYGVTSGTLVGKHADILILDDLHSPENTQTPDQLKKMVDLFDNTIQSRISPGKGSRTIVAGRRWATDDLYGVLGRRKSWVILNLPCMRPETDSNLLKFDVFVPDNFLCVFSERSGKTGWMQIPYAPIKPRHGYAYYWPEMEQAERLAHQVRLNNPSVFEAVYQGNPAEEEGRLFARKDFEFYVLSEAWVRRIRETDAKIITAWDTSLTEAKESDPSAGIVAALLPCNKSHRAGADWEAEEHYDIYLLDCLWGRFGFSEIINKIKEFQKQWNAEAILVENKASGLPLIDALKDTLPITAVDPGGLSKATRASQGLGAGSAKGWVSQGRVFLPQGAEWVSGFLDEIEAFTGKKGGRDDRTDAFVYIANFAIGSNVGGGMVADFPDEAETQEVEQDPYLLTSSTLGRMLKERSPIADVLGPHCAICKNYRDGFCLIHKIRVSNIASCERFEMEEPDEFTSPDAGWIGPF